MFFVQSRTSNNMSFLQPCKYIQQYSFFLEFDVPPENSSLNLPIEEFLNNASLVGSSCDVCKKKVQVEVKNQITNIKETEFITVILRRGVSALEGFTLNQSKVDSTADVFVR